MKKVRLSSSQSVNGKNKIILTDGTYEHEHMTYTFTYEYIYFKEKVTQTKSTDC